MIWCGAPVLCLLGVCTWHVATMLSISYGVSVSAVMVGGVP